MKKEGLFHSKVDFLANQIKTSEKFYRNCLTQHTTYTNKLRSISLKDLDKTALYSILASENDGEKLIQSL